MSEPIVRTLCKRKQAQDTEYTHFISKEGHSQSNVSENTCKNSLDAIRIFLRPIEDTYQVDKITWTSGTTIVEAFSREFLDKLRENTLISSEILPPHLCL